MSYRILILRRAQKELGALPKDIYDRIKDAILSLKDEARPKGCKKLSGRDGWRIRVGDYRIIYEIDDENKEILILHVGHRKYVYR